LPHPGICFHQIAQMDNPNRLLFNSYCSGLRFDNLFCEQPHMNKVMIALLAGIAAGILLAPDKGSVTAKSSRMALLIFLISCLIW
jgi:hypothetical protein